MPLDGTTYLPSTVEPPIADDARVLLRAARAYVAHRGKPNGPAGISHPWRHLWLPTLQFCVISALAVVCDRRALPEVCYRAALDRLRAAGGFASNGELTRWHDDLATTLTDVLALLDRALA